MQCKDIPEEPILRFLAGEIDGYEGWPAQGVANWFEQDGVPYANSVLRAMPPGTTRKLARAKMGMMIRKGLVDGCACGCRGDFALTDRGRASIPASEADTAPPGP